MKRTATVPIFVRLLAFAVLCGPITLAYGQTRGALSLEGQGFAQAADNAALDIASALTVEAWIKHDGQSDADAIILIKGDAEGYLNYAFSFVGEGEEVPVQFAVQWHTYAAVSDVGIPAHQWTHVAGVYDGNDISLYVNGELSGTYDLTGESRDTTEPLVIGSTQSGNERFYSGLIDEVRIWNTARAVVDLQSTIFSVLPTGAANLAAYYSFNGDANDALGTSNLTLSGDASIDAAPGVFPIAPDLFATAGNASVTLNWGERLGAGNANLASQFKVYRSTQADQSDRQLVTTLSAGTTTFTDTGLENGTTYYYEITALDATGAESDFSYVVTATPYATGGGGALSLSGGGFVEANDRPSLDIIENLTVEAWIKHDGQSDADAIILIKGDAEGYLNYAFSFVGEGEEVPVQFAVQWHTYAAVSDVGIPAHQWTHVAGVYDGNDISLYVNGELSGTYDLTGESRDTEEPLVIGATPAGNARFYSGLIDEVRIWEDTRTAFEITNSFETSLTGMEDNLVAYYQFNDVGATSALGSDVGPTSLTLNGDAEIVAQGVYPVPPRVFAASEGTSVQLTLEERHEGNAATLNIYRSTQASGADRELVATVPATTTSYVDADLTTGTTYFYQVAAVNAAGQESDLSYASSVTVAAEVAGNALQLDGSQDYAVATNRPSLDIIDDDVSVEAWINFNAESEEDAIIVMKGDPEGYLNYALTLVGDGARRPVSFAATWYQYAAVSEDSVDAGEWTHVAGVYDGSSISIYVNGELSGTYTLSGDSRPSEEPLVIGSTPAGNARFYSGLIDDVRIWGDARTAFEIEENYRTVLTGNEEDLVAYFRFDETGGTTARGSDPFTQTLSLQGDASFTGTGSHPVPNENEAPLPKAFTLEGNFPNPFNPQTTIRFGLNEAAPVRVTVYDMMGREVAVLADGKPLSAGWHEVTFEANNLPSGIYVYRVQAGQSAEVGRMVLLK